MSAADPTPIDADAGRYQAAIDALIRDGLQISADLAAQDTPAADKAEPFERLARAIRRTILLARHLAENPVQPAKPPAPSAQEDKTGAKITLARRRIVRELDNDIVHGAGADERINSLRNELREHLEDPALDLAILHGSVPEIIETIRHDLGLVDSRYRAPVPRRTPDQVRRLNGLAAPPVTPDPDEVDEPEDIEPEDIEPEDIETEDPDEAAGFTTHPLTALLAKRHRIPDG